MTTDVIPIRTQEEKIAHLKTGEPIFVMTYDDKEYCELIEACMTVQRLDAVFESGDRVWYTTITFTDNWLEATWFKSAEEVHSLISPAASDKYKVAKITITEEPA